MDKLNMPSRPKSATYASMPTAEPYASIHSIQPDINAYEGTKPVSLKAKRASINLGIPVAPRSTVSFADNSEEDSKISTRARMTSLSKRMSMYERSRPTSISSVLDQDHGMTMPEPIASLGQSPMGRDDALQGTQNVGSYHCRYPSNVSLDSVISRDENDESKSLLTSHNRSQMDLASRSTLATSVDNEEQGGTGSLSPTTPTKILMDRDDDDEDDDDDRSHLSGTKHTEKIMVDSLSFDYHLPGSGKRGEYDMLPTMVGDKKPSIGKITLKRFKDLFRGPYSRILSTKPHSSEKSGDIELGLIDRASASIQAVAPFVRSRFGRAHPEAGRVEKASKKRPTVSLESIIQSRHLTPISLQDFRHYLKSEENSLQDLDFLQVLADYRQRFNALTPEEQGLSPHPFHIVEDLTIAPTNQPASARNSLGGMPSGLSLADAMTARRVSQSSATGGISDRRVSVDNSNGRMDTGAETIFSAPDYGRKSTDMARSGSLGGLSSPTRSMHMKHSAPAYGRPSLISLSPSHQPMRSSMETIIKRFFTIGSFNEIQSLPESTTLQLKVDSQLTSNPGVFDEAERLVRSRLETKIMPRFLATSLKNIARPTASGRLAVGILALLITIMISIVMLLDFALPRAVRLALIPLWAIVMGHGISARTQVCFWMSLCGVREEARKRSDEVEASSASSTSKSVASVKDSATSRSTSELDFTCGGEDSDKESLIKSSSAGDNLASGDETFSADAEAQVDRKRRLPWHHHINRANLSRAIGLPAHLGKVQDPAIRSIQRSLAKRVASVILIASGLSAILVSLVP